MKRKVIVRPIKTDDIDNVLSWARNHLEDPRKLVYPSMQISASENGKVLQFMFLNGVAMIEGFAPNPDAKDGELALGMKTLIDAAVETCRMVGVMEIYALTGKGDEKLERFAERHGWQRLPVQVWRRNV